MYKRRVRLALTLLVLATIIITAMFTATACNFGSNEGGDKGGDKTNTSYYKLAGEYKVGTDIEAGEYKVGTDIEAGEYLLIADTQSEDTLSSAYFEVKLKANADINSSDFLYNANFYYRHYVQVEDGQYMRFSACKLYKIASYPAVNKSAKNWHTGQYKVGKDIDAGEYKLTANSDTVLTSGYYVTTLTPNGQIGTNDFIDNCIFAGAKTITLEANTYIYFHSATMTKA